MFVLAAAALVAASTNPGACALVPPDAIASVQGAKYVSSKESRAKGPAIERRDCFYQTDPFVDSVSLEWSADSAPGGARRRWNTLFHGAGAGEPREREEEHEAAKAPPAPVAGVGDEAFWVAQPHGGALYVLAGDAGFLRVSVGGAGKPEEKRERCRRIAARAVESLRAAAGADAKGKKEASAAAKDQAHGNDLR